MYKRIISFLLVILAVISLPFTIFAENYDLTISVSDGSGSANITVFQGTTQLYPGGTSYTGLPEENGSFVVSISSVPDYYYPTINGVLATVSTLPANVGSINVAVTKFTPPTISLSINSSGGVSYEVFGSSPINNFEIEVFEGSTSKGSFSTTSSSGNLPSVLEGKSYTAAARFNSLGFRSEYGTMSNSVTVPSAFSLIVKGTDGGTVNDVSNSYISGAKISLTATPSSGYSFIEWTSNGEGTFEDSKARETTFTMPAKNVTVTATFGKTYKFVIMSSNGGKVWDVDGNYYEGQSVKVSAIPGDGYVFDSWVSSDGGKFNDSKAVSTTFTMPANATTVTATFKESGQQTNKPEVTTPEDNVDDVETGMFEIKTTVVGNGNIVINQNRAHEGQKITVRATAQAGYVFSSWSSDGGGSFIDPAAPATTFNMPGDNVTIIATFVPGEGATTTDENKPEDKEEKTGLSKGLLIAIIVGVVVIAAVIVAILLIARERARRQEAYDDSYFAGDNEETEQDSYNYDDATREISYEETEETEEQTEDRDTSSKVWRQQRKRRNQFSDNNNVYRADDWDD